MSAVNIVSKKNKQYTLVDKIKRVNAKKTIDTTTLSVVFTRDH